MPSGYYERLSPVTRLLNGIEYDTNGGCWLWTRGMNSYGYGEIKVEYRSVYTHRLAYEEFVGPIPPGLQVLHRCDVPACCNPGHLFAGTHADNMADMVSKGRCRPGSKNNTRTHLPDGVCREIAWRVQRGERPGYKVVARRFAVDPKTVRRTVARYLEENDVSA